MTKNTLKLIVSDLFCHSPALGDCISVGPPEGMAYLYLYESNGKYGFVEYNCQNIKADSCKSYGEAIFNDYVEIGSKLLALKIENHWNIYDYSGQQRSNFKLDTIYGEPIGRRQNQYYRIVANGKMGLINTEGEVIVDPNYEYIVEMPENFYLTSKVWYWSSQELFLVSTRHDYFYIDTNGLEYNCQP